MISKDQLELLERLSRLRDGGVLNEDDLQREKALVLGEDAGPNRPAVAPKGAAGLWGGRRAVLAVAGVAAVGTAGWGLAHWTIPSPSPHISVKNAVIEAKASATAAPPPRSTNSQVRSLPATRQLALAFEAVFGRGPRRYDKGNQARYENDNGRLTWTSFGPVLSVEGAGDPSPPVLGTLGIYYLREGPGLGFTVMGRWPAAVDGSIMGNPPRWTIRHDLSRWPVIEAVSGGVWQGYACSTTTLVALSPEGPAAIAVFDSEYSSGGAEGEDSVTYEGRIANVVRDRSFDVQFTGTRDITQHYARRGAKFIRAVPVGTDQADSDIPTC